MKNNTLDTNTLNFAKGDGLITAVVQDVNSGTVLMVGYQSLEAIEKTNLTGQVTFWSRTKERLWTKGEESGNVLKVKDAKVDCDQDTILYLVKAPEATCHTGSFSCFAEGSSFGFVTGLFQLIKNRQALMPEGSYVTSLFRDGLDRIAQKVGEEAVETVIAAKNNDKEEFLNESSDLLFHLLVLCAEKDIDISEVIGQLKDRS